MKFLKIQSVGNDYVYLVNVNLSDDKLKELAIKLSDRRFGIGSDGLITVGTSVKNADAKMRIFNADGSEAKMCGNGIRGVCLILSSKKIKPCFVVDTLSGLKRITPEFYYKNHGTYKVDMGKATIGNNEKMRFVYKNKTYTPFIVNIGNNHAVYVLGNENLQDFANKLLSRKMNESYNLEVVKVLHRKEIEVKFIEKGSGITLSCGTGACASVVACKEKGLVENHVAVKTDGGILLVGIKNGEVYLTGDSVLVYKGDMDI